MGLFKKKKGQADTSSLDSGNEEIAAVMAAAIAASEDDDLPVVLAAAIAAYESDQYMPTLAIRKINRAAGVRPVWGILGTTESIDVRRM